MDIYVELYRYLYPHRFLFLRGHHWTGHQEICVVQTSVTSSINVNIIFLHVLFWHHLLEKTSRKMSDISLKELICISFVASHFEIIVSNVRSPLVSIKWQVQTLIEKIIKAEASTTVPSMETFEGPIKKPSQNLRAMSKDLIWIHIMKEEYEALPSSIEYHPEGAQMVTGIRKATSIPAHLRIHGSPEDHPASFARCERAPGWHRKIDLGHPHLRAAFSSRSDHQCGTLQVASGTEFSTFGRTWHRSLHPAHQRCIPLRSSKQREWGSSTSRGTSSRPSSRVWIGSVASCATITFHFMPVVWQQRHHAGSLRHQSEMTVFHAGLMIMQWSLPDVYKSQLTNGCIQLRISMSAPKHTIGMMYRGHQDHASYVIECNAENIDKHPSSSKDSPCVPAHQTTSEGGKASTDIIMQEVVIGLDCHDWHQDLKHQWEKNISNPSHGMWHIGWTTDILPSVQGGHQFLTILSRISHLMWIASVCSID